MRPLNSKVSSSGPAALSPGASAPFEICRTELKTRGHAHRDHEAPDHSRRHREDRHHLRAARQTQRPLRARTRHRGHRLRAQLQRQEGRPLRPPLRVQGRRGDHPRGRLGRQHLLRRRRGHARRVRPRQEDLGEQQGGGASAGHELRRDVDPRGRAAQRDHRRPARLEGDRPRSRAPGAAPAAQAPEVRRAARLHLPQARPGPHARGRARGRRARRSARS